MQPLTLAISVGAEDADAEEIDALTRQLLSEIRDLEIESAELAPGGVAPAGTKSGGIVELGSLLVSALPAATATLLNFLQIWVGRNSDRVIKLKTQIGDRNIEVEYDPKSMSKEELGELVGTISSALISAN